MIAKILLAISGLLCLLASGDATTSEDADLDSLRAAMIEKIAGFIEWPAPPSSSITSTPPTPLSICVTPEHPQLAALRLFYQPTPGTPPTTVLVVHKRVDPGSLCRVLFLAPRDIATAADLTRLRTLAEREHILLIAEGKRVARECVHVGFYFENGRRRIEVNRRALEAAGLKASFRLLELATKVGC